MQHGTAVELLARAPVFHGLSGELLGVILQRSTTAQLRAGQTIAEAGTPAEAALFVIEGTATRRDASGRDLEPIMGPGAVLSEMAMLIETSHIHGAVARGAVIILSVSRAAMGQLMAAEPRLAAHFAGNIRRNLAATAETLQQLDSLLTEPIGAGPYSNDPAPRDETTLPAAGLSVAPDQSAPQSSGVENSGATGFGPNDADPPVPDFLGQPAAVASRFSALADRSVRGTSPAIPVHDLLADLNRANGAANQTRSAPVRDQTAAPSRAPHRPRAATPRLSSAPASPIHGQGAGRG